MAEPERGGADDGAPFDDAAEVLREQEDAQTFELPDRSGASAPDLLPGMSFGRAERAPRAPESSPSRRSDVHTLEDLWAAYPKIGRGDWKYRVERLHPKTYGGVQVAGILGDFFERMSMEEFRAKFGGNTYEITVMQPVGEGGPDGAAGYRRIKTIKLRLPGSPTMAGVEEDDSMRGQPPYHQPGGYVSAGDHPQVRTREMELEHQRLRDEREERMRLEGELRDTLRERSHAPEGALETLSTSQRMAFDEVKRTNESALMMWQEQAEMLRAEVKAKDAEINQIRRDLAEATVQAANTARHIETEAMRQQKERYDDELRRLRDDHAERVQRLQEDHRKEVADITGRHTDERRNYESQQQLERERVRDDAKSRIEAAQEQARREVDNMRRDYESRIEDARRQQERELQNLKERFESEVRAVEASEKSQAAFSREASEMKVAISAEQAARYEAESQQLRQEVEELRAKLHKPPMEALMEAKEMAGVLGMVEASEMKAEVEQQTVGQQLFGLAKGVVDNIPKIVERVTDARSQSQVDQARQQREIAMLHRRQQQQMPGRPMPGQHQLALPPGVAPSPRGVPGIGSMPPPMMPPGDVGVPMQAGALDALHQPGAFPLQGGMPVNVPSPVQPGEAQPQDTAPMPMGAGPVSMPIGAQPGMSFDAPVAPPVPDAQPSSQQQQAPPQPPFPAADPRQEPGGPGPLPALATLPPEAVQEFFQNLEMAVQTKAVPPEAFAQQFVERVGVERSAQLVGEVNPGDIIDIVREAGGDSSAMATRDGYRYVEELWIHAQRICQQQAGAPSPEPAAAEQPVMVSPPADGELPMQVPDGGDVVLPDAAPVDPNEEPPVIAPSDEPAPDAQDPAPDASDAQA